MLLKIFTATIAFIVLTMYFARDRPMFWEPFKISLMLVFIGAAIVTFMIVSALTKFLIKLFVRK